MNPTPTPPPGPKSFVPDVRVEQVLDLLSEHTASNERVVAAAERLETEFPKRAETILAEHRRALASMPSPAITIPKPSEEPIRRVADLVHLWGGILTVLIGLVLCGIIYIISR